MIAFKSISSSLRLIALFLLFFSCTENRQSEMPEDEPAVKYDDVVLPERPNILWLVAEDLSPYLPFYGDSTIETPTLSRLAAQGICFDNFYSPAPVCSPSRAAIATGMYPTRIAAGHMRNGGNPMYLPEGLTPYEAIPPQGTRMMSEWLRMKGYYCTNHSKEDYQFNKTPTAWDESSNQAHWRNRERGQPFFAVFNFGVTHESQIWAKADDPWQVDSNLTVPVPPYLPDTETGRRDVRRMYSNVVEMDRQVGEILQQLEEDGELENTVIFWYSDHGGPLPRQKRLLYDSGLKVPMIVRFPQQQFAGSRDDRLISFIDLAPTVMSLAGIAPKDYMDGRDFLGEHQPDTERKYIHAAADRFDAETDCNRAVRDERYKYIRYYYPEKSMFLHSAYRDQQPIMRELYRLRDADSLTDVQKLWFRDHKPPFEFFDTWNDPHEVHDLSDDPQYAGKIRELSDEMDRWLEAIDDTGIIPEEELLKKIWPNGTQPVTAAPEIEMLENKVAIQCQTPGASIGYKIIDENDKSGSWKVYTEPVEKKENQQIIAVAHRIGYIPSEEVTYK
ncbi:MAG: sulfatase-like hydrolase/transferase [Saprospiraceae bacterium]|nr:sulfatase-like hydrolase/transferase [Saprospiraceae bacterium]